MFEPDYNVLGKRLFPRPDFAAPTWSGAWVVLPAGETSTPHDHGEAEVFFIVEGDGLLRIGDKTRSVAFGDTIFISPGEEHEVTNDGPGRLVFISIWWQPPTRTDADPDSR
jgi:mannose-6-phosphate isomerase-like protein (cupin superfamily)